MKITNPITLDVARSNSYICLLAKQFDSNSRYLEITLADNGQPLTIPADASAVLRATRADGTGAVVSGTVANGKATVEIDDYILEVNGAVTFSLEISKDGETLTTPSCNLTVQKADANGWIRVYVADANKVAGNYYITIGGVSYSFTTSQAIPAGGSVYFSSNNATAETRDATGTVIETGLVLTEGTTGTQLVTDVPTMSFLATIAGRVAALESEMPNKADKDGIIALANNLTPYSADSGATQSVPFINQGTGCGNGESVIDTGSYAQVKKKLGNTVCVNQLLPAFASGNGWQAYRGTVAFADGVATFTVTNSGSSKQVFTQRIACPAGRVSRSVVYVKPSKAITARISMGSGNVGNLTACPANVWTAVSFNGTLTNAVSEWACYVDGNSALDVNDTVQLKEAVFSDLDIWYGSHDRIPSHLLSHPEDFGRYYSGSLAYNPGQLVNADGSVLKSIGRNVWDEKWEQGGIDSSSGLPETDSSRIRSKNLIPSIPGATYYIHGARISWIEYDSNGTYLRAGFAGSFVGADADFTISADAHFIKFFTTATYGGTYKNDITISLYYPGESGYDQYYPYTVLAEVDTGSEVLRSAGAVADEKTPDGTITRRVGSVDMGTLTWTYVTNDGEPYFYAPISDKKIEPFNIQSGKYVASSLAGTTNLPDKGIVGSGSMARVFVRDTAYTDASVLTSALSGVYLNYQLATPTTEQGTSFPSNIPCDDFGSLIWTQTNGVPQGVEIFYPYNYAGFLDQLIRAAGGDAGQIPTANPPTADGTYTFKATVSGGAVTYSWVAE